MINKIDLIISRAVPLVAISTPDPVETLRTIYLQIRSKRMVWAWDIVRGIFPAVKECPDISPNQLDMKAANFCNQDFIKDADYFRGNPINLLTAMASDDQFKEESVVIMYNANDYFMDPIVRQAIWNLRDINKRKRKCLILLGATILLPPQLQNDVVLIDHPYPDDEEILRIINLIETSIKPQRGNITVAESEIRKACLLLRGLSGFQVEQFYSLAITNREPGIDFDILAQLQYAAIEQTPGLKVDKGSLTFDDLGGLDSIKQFSERLFKNKYFTIVRIEEIEKVMAGAAGDLSGVSQDALQVLLNAMEDNKWLGLIAFGPPGSGKSLYSQVLANTFGFRSLALDLGACKGSLVGESEQKIREAIRRLKGLGRSNVFFVATCNATTFPAELRRRFNCGIWMFDLPNAEERKSIWKIHIRRFGLDPDQPLPNDEGWSGANIYTCCQFAYYMNIPLKDASIYVRPAISENSALIESIRKEAENRYLSANYPGVYTGYSNESKFRTISIS